MNTRNFFKRHFRWLNLPTLSLLAFLQRSPVVQVAATAEEFVLASPIGNVLKAVAATVASLGAMNSLVGATPLVPSAGAASGTTLTAGVMMSPIGFTVTPTQTQIQSWDIGGTIPAGLSFSGRTTPGGVNIQSLVLSGTPTTAGSYSVMLQAYDGANRSGFSSAIYTYTITVNAGAAAAPAITTQPQSQASAPGISINLSAVVTGSPAPTFQWAQNGVAVAGASATLALTVQPGSAGLYTVTATNAAGAVTSSAAIVGVTTASTVVGTGTVVGLNIKHPNGNHFDQVLVTGPAETITAAYSPDPTLTRLTRTSYIDLNNNIVQIEFAGPGTLSLVLDSASAAAAPVNYNQPTVSYAKGHAGIVITGANENTNVSVFTVGRATAFDPTGAYNILQSPSATNVPANNGSSLFVGHGATAYDGVADIAFIAISSTDGKFGGVRASNADFSAVNGRTGVYAPGVQFTGPVFIGNIGASGTATPVILLGSATDVRITGGDLAQANGAAVQVSGFTQLKFAAGQDSGGNTLAEKTNQAVLKNTSGQDVTAQTVAQ